MVAIGRTGLQTGNGPTRAGGVRTTAQVVERRGTARKSTQLPQPRALAVAQEGDFDLEINTHFVNSGGRYNNAEEWASTIAHEMLHNLGHRHPEDQG